MADSETAAAPARPVASLLERDAEVDEPGGLVRDIGSGDGRVVLIEGPAGIGKSRLLAETRRQANHEIPAAVEAGNKAPQLALAA